jgi:antitoxin (DNA-binding transcriptional repressor) of toxin-antitoxin stability system
MMRVSCDEAKERLPELIDAALRGEAVFIAVDARHAVQLTPVRIAHG